MEKVEVVRVTIKMSKEIHEFYKRMATEMGIATSAAMVFGMRSYMDMQKGLNATDEIKELKELLEIVKTQTNKE